jgi:hypothetical protein
VKVQGIASDYAGINRRALELARKKQDELRAAILAIDPEATFVDLHDEIVITVSREKVQAVQDLMISRMSWGSER